MTVPAGPLSGLAIVPRQDGSEMIVHAVPGAKRGRVLGLHGDALRVAVDAPAEKGRANEALLELLAEVVGKKTSELVISSGEKGRRKRVLFRGIQPDELRARLEEAMRRT